MKPAEPFIKFRAFNLNQNNYDKKVIEILRGMKNALETLGRRDLAPVIETAEVNFARALQRNTQTTTTEFAFPPESYQMLNFVFRQVAKELSGIVEPNIISNEIIQAFGSIYLDTNGRFRLNTYQIMYAISMYTGKNVEFSKVNELARIYSVPQLNIMSFRTTVTLIDKNLISQYGNRFKAVAYLVSAGTIVEAQG